MPFLSGGSPEGDERVRRLNIRASSLDDQTKAFIRDFYMSLPTDEKAEFRDYLRSYRRLHSNTKYLVRFGALRQNLAAWVANQPAHSDVMIQTRARSLPTVEQLLSVVNEIEPLD